MKHYRFGGSGADRYINCAGSTALIETLPPKAGSRYANEGSAAHHLAALCLTKDQHPTEFIGAAFPEWPDHPVTQEMCDAVVVYLNAVTHELAKTKEAELYVETQFELDVPGAEGEVGGTVDAMVYHPKLGRLVSFDYKHGAGVSVSAEDSAQLKFYAAGAVFSKDDWRIKELELVIVQPRDRSLSLLPDDADLELMQGIKRWPMNPLELLEFSGEIADAVALAKFRMTDFTTDPVVLKGPLPPPVLDFTPGSIAYVGGKPPYTSGSWCRWCDAAAVCPLREQEVLRAAQLDFAHMTEITADALPDPKTYDMDRLGEVLKTGQILNAWLNQVQEYVETLVLSGQPVAGWKAVEKISRAKWVSADEEVADYTDMMFGIPVDEIRPRKLTTITEAEKLLKAAGATKTQVDDFKLRFTVKESSGLTIAPSSDRRSAVDALATDFKAVQIDAP